MRGSLLGCNLAGIAVVFCQKDSVAPGLGAAGRADRRYRDGARAGRAGLRGAGRRHPEDEEAGGAEGAGQAGAQSEGQAGGAGGAAAGGRAGREVGG